MLGYFKVRICKHILGHTLVDQNSKRAFLIKRYCLTKLREGNSIAKTVRIVGPVYSHCVLSIGDDTFIGSAFRCEGNGHVTIGKNCDIAPQVTILTGTHHIGDTSHRAGKGITTDVTIGDGTWIGACSIILPGIRIGQGCVIGAGSVVTKDMPDNTLAKGVPAKFSAL